MSNNNYSNKKIFKRIESKKPICEYNEDVKLKGLYLAKSAHELKNIFISISSFIENKINNNVTLENSNSNDNTISDNLNANHNLRFLSSLCDFGMNLIQDITTISKKDNFTVNKLEINERTIEEFQLIDCLNFCIQIFKSRLIFEKKNISIISNFNINKNLKVKSINEVRLKQVIINLLSNSFKFTLSGKIVLSVDIISDKKLQIKISDTGVGFNKDEIKDIFSPFSQVYSNQNLNKNGSGLGLYIVKDILKSFGSDIQYDSQKDIGSSFWFDIEYVKEDVIIDPFNLFSETLKNMIYDINNGKRDNVEIKNEDNNSSNNDVESLPKITNNINNLNNKFQTHKYNNNKLNKLLERRKKNFNTYKQNSRKSKEQNEFSQIILKENKYKNYKLKQNHFISANNTTLMRCYSDINAINVFDKKNIFTSIKKFNILICDDDSFTALSTRNLLIKCFKEKLIKTSLTMPEILFAQNGIECLYFTYQYLIKENPIRVILMDENMPFINGCTVSILLKEMYEMNDIKIYILSSQDLDITESKADGFYDKPLSKKDIIEIFQDKV